MAALLGLRAWDGDATVLTPITLGAQLLSVAIPAGTTIAGIDIDVSDLDSAASPLILLDIGDAVDQDRIAAAQDIAQSGGLLEVRPLPAEWYRYNVASAVLVTVQTAPATGAGGAIAATIYGYPSVDVAVLVRRTLQQLGVVAEGETPRAEDASLALEALADVHEMCIGKRIAKFPGKNLDDLVWPLSSVPSFAARAYAALAGDLLADTFSLSSARKTALAARASAGEKELRRQTRTPSDGEAVSLEPYTTPDPAILDYSVFS